MKSIFFLQLLIFVNFTYSHSQSIATIKDKDGYTNIRKEPSINSAIIGKIYEDEIIWVDDFNVSDTTQWIGVSHFTKNPKNKLEQKDLFGYMHKSRIQYIENFNNIPLIFYKNKLIKLKNDTIDILINYEYCTMKDALFDNIDGCVFGFDTECPMYKLPEHYSNYILTRIRSVQVVVKNDTIYFPDDAVNKLYSINGVQARISKTGTIYIVMDNSDGAGSYDLIWVVRKNKYFAR
jgi:hypothetical protein